MTRAKVVFMTGDGLRHRYAAHVLSSCLDLCGIVSEEKPVLTAHLQNTTEQDDIINEHFAQRDMVERKLLGEQTFFPEHVPILKIAHGHSNSLEVFDWVVSNNPDVIVLYGTSIIKAPLLEFYKDRMINLHLGLSPYYRGSGTNFWPLVDGLPECVGATIHLATLDVDAGDILVQVRPENITVEDRAHEIGTKTIIAGLQKMCDIVPAYLEGRVQPVAQDLLIGKVFRRRDFNDVSVQKMWKNFDDGMMDDYIMNKEERDKRFPIYHRVQ